MKRAVLGLFACMVSLSSLACGRYPTPLNPAIRGSLGTANKGLLVDGVLLANHGNVRWLRHDERHFGIPRFTRAIERAADAVARERPGAPLVVGDVSAPRGGRLSHHASHVSGRDADLLFYLTTLEGAPIASPGFLRFEADGLAFDPGRGRYVRLDVEREWLLVKTLVEDPEARVQFVFVNDVVKAILLEHALARGDDPETVYRAQQLMLQSGGPHDDHIHVRTACAYEDVVAGCEATGVIRPWLYEAQPPADKTEELVLALLRPLAEMQGAEASRASR